MASVRQCISTGEVEKAVELARELESSPEHYAEAVKVLESQDRPELFCPKCRTQIPVRFITSSLRYVFAGACSVCAENEQARKDDAARKRAKQFYLDHLDDTLRERGMPKKYLPARLSDFPKAVANTEPKSLYLCGDRGVGKTHLACAIARFSAENREPVRYSEIGERITFKVSASTLPMYISVPVLLMEIRDSFKNDSAMSEKKLIEKYGSAPFLILDDLGVEKTTDWSLQTLYTLINRRYEEELVTIITSNLSLKELAEKVGDRIASRIAEMCEVKVMKGEDRRLKRGA